jgi:hypothetical protein
MSNQGSDDDRRRDKLLMRLLKTPPLAGAVVADLGGLVLREIDRMQRIAGPRSVVSGGSEGPLYRD